MSHDHGDNHCLEQETHMSPEQESKLPLDKETHMCLDQEAHISRISVFLAWGGHNYFCGQVECQQASSDRTN